MMQGQLSSTARVRGQGPGHRPVRLLAGLQTSTLKSTKHQVQVQQCGQVQEEEAEAA